MRRKTESARTESPHLGLIVFSGDFPRVHYALSMAAAAAATNTPAILFFTHEASRALLAQDCKSGSGGTGGSGGPGWHGLAGADGKTAAAIDADYVAKGVAGFEELLAACAELSVTLMVCEMGLRALGLEDAPRRPEIEVAVGGIVTFLNQAGDNGRLIFI